VGFLRYIGRKKENGGSGLKDRNGKKIGKSEEKQEDWVEEKKRARKNNQKRKGPGEEG